MKKILFHDSTFTFMMLFAVLVEAFFIYMAIRMSNKRKDVKLKKDINRSDDYMKTFIVLSVVWAILVIIFAYRHFTVHRKNNLIHKSVV